MFISIERDQKTNNIILNGVKYYKSSETKDSKIINKLEIICLQIENKKKTNYLSH